MTIFHGRRGRGVESGVADTAIHRQVCVIGRWWRGLDEIAEHIECTLAL